MTMLRRRRSTSDHLPEPWREIIVRRLAAWSHLDGAERQRLERIVLDLIADKRWTTDKDFEVTDEVMVTIAAHAALLVIGDGLGPECYRNVTSIEVHSSTIHIRGEQHSGLAGGLMFDGVTALAGQAQIRGPIMLAWDAVDRDVNRPGAGRNVVLHEFAHALDMLDGAVDGTPPLARGEVAQWVEACLGEFEELRRCGHDEHGLLDIYAAENPAEFFAVATEAFFDRPVALHQLKPALYEVLAGFYGQDPAARQHRVRSPDGTSHRDGGLTISPAISS